MFSKSANRQSSTKFMYWSELLLIQIMIPNASFLGHLAGIIAGICCKFIFVDEANCVRYERAFRRSFDNRRQFGDDVLYSK